MRSSGFGFRREKNSIWKWIGLTALLTVPSLAPGDMRPPVKRAPADAAAPGVQPKYQRAPGTAETTQPPPDTTLAPELVSSIFTTRDPTAVDKFDVMSHMKSGSVEVQFCSEHFPVGSQARLELQSAVEHFRRLPFVGISLTLVDVPHRDGDGLFKTPRNNVIAVDLVDVKDGKEHHCHKKVKGDNGWIANACKHGDWGWDSTGGLNLVRKADYGVLQINANRTSGLKLEGLLHEFGHMFGISHSPYWPADQSNFLSVAGAFQDTLTARDIEFLQRLYPAAEAGPPAADYALADKILNDDDGATRPAPGADCDLEDDPAVCEESKHTVLYTTYNTRSLYVDAKDPYLKDCRTLKHPVVKATLYNLAGTARSDRLELSSSFSIQLPEANGRTMLPHLIAETASVVRTGMRKNDQLDWKSTLRIPASLRSKMFQLEDRSRWLVDMNLMLKPSVHIRDERHGDNNSVSKIMYTVFPSQANCP